MIEILYITDSIKQSINFINGLICELNDLGIKDIAHDRQHNFIIVKNMKIKGLSIYESYICHGMRNIKYFIDRIDMRTYKDASEIQIDSLIYYIKDIMTHFNKDTRQLDSKNELIKILIGK